MECLGVSAVCLLVFPGQGWEDQKTPLRGVRVVGVVGVGVGSNRKLMFHIQQIRSKPPDAESKQTPGSEG